MEQTKALKCLVVDDEPLAARLIESYINNTDGLEVGGVALDAVTAFEIIKSKNIDAVFLDIQMPGMTGIEFADAISKTGIKVVFITAYAAYALDGFRIGAVDYLLKPVSYEDFMRAASRILNDLPVVQVKSPAFITVKSDYSQVRIALEDILYIESLKDYAKFFLKNQARPIISLISMKNLEAELPEDSFMRVHRSYIVNLNEVRGYDRGKAVFSNGASVPISLSNKRNFLSRIE